MVKANVECLSDEKIISREEYENILWNNAVKERLKELPGCPFYKEPSILGRNATCLSRKEGDWISGSKETQKFCKLHYRECQRYEKAGAKDKEYELSSEAYMKELFGSMYLAPKERDIYLEKEKIRKERGIPPLSGKLKEVGEKIKRECSNYLIGNRCRDRLDGVPCWLWDNTKTPDYAPERKRRDSATRSFKIVKVCIPIGMSFKELDKLWMARTEISEKEIDLKRTIINYILKNNKVTKKNIINLNVVSARTVRYHFDKIMLTLGIKGKKDRSDKRYKVYRSTNKRVYLKRVLKKLEKIEKRKSTILNKHKTLKVGQR